MSPDRIVTSVKPFYSYVPTIDVENNRGYTTLTVDFERALIRIDLTKEPAIALRKQLLLGLIVFLDAG